MLFVGLNGNIDGPSTGPIPGGSNEAAGLQKKALEKLESEYSDLKQKIKLLDEKDEALEALLERLGNEIDSIELNPNASLDRASDVISMLNERLKDHHSPIKQLQRKIQKTQLLELNPQGDEMAENEETQIKNAMEAKLKEEGQRRKEEALFSNPKKSAGPTTNTETVPKPELKPSPEPKPPALKEKDEVEEGYFEPAEPSEPEYGKLEEDLNEETEDEDKNKDNKEKELKEEKHASQEKVNAERAESLFQSSLDILAEAQLENGAIIPTTSIKSYFHVFPRDHAFCTLALINAGKFEEAKKALEFAIKHQNKKTGAFPQRWDEAGNDTGYKPIQPDATALVLYSFARYIIEKNNIAFSEGNWEKAEKAIDFLNEQIVKDKNLIFSDSSIHEFPPVERGYDIWANAVCCAAFRELSEVADRIKAEYAPVEKENVLKDAIMEYLWNSREKTFVKSIRIKESASVFLGPDASVLALSFFDVFPVKDKMLVDSIKFLDSKLWHKQFGGISNHAESCGRESGGYGVSPFFTLLLANHYIKAGNQEKANQYLNWILSISFNGMLPEHISTKSEFEAFVSDFSDAGLLNKQRMKLIDSTRKQDNFKNGVAHITEPFSMAHAAFIIVWLNYKEKFLK